MIRLGIYGYGNLGRGIEKAVKLNAEIHLQFRLHAVHL